MRRRLAYGAALFLFLVVYFVTTIGVAVTIARFADYQWPETSTWWSYYVRTPVIVVVAGNVGAILAVAVIGKLFRSIRMKPVALGFLAVLALVWLINLVSLMKGAGTGMELAGFLGALVSALTALGRARYRDLRALANFPT